MENNSIELIKLQLLSDQNFIQKLRLCFLQEITNRSELNQLIEQIRQLLQSLIRIQIESQLKEIINDNNRILRTIHQNMQPNRSLINKVESASFSQIHRLMEDERKKINLIQQPNDAYLQKSISTFVELKMQTIDERVNSIDKRLSSVEDKYQTNLKGIWNVLSVTQSTLFDHLKTCTNSYKQTEYKDNTLKETDSDKKYRFGFLGFRR